MKSQTVKGHIPGWGVRKETGIPIRTVVSSDRWLSQVRTRKDNPQERFCMEQGHHAARLWNDSRGGGFVSCHFRNRETSRAGWRRGIQADTRKP